MISLGALTLLVWLALFVTIIAPVLLIGLFIRDTKKGDLW